MEQKYSHIKYKRSAKKKGFTLIEMLAVISIILILSSVMFPKVTGYINKAKKLKVIDQCRKIAMAVEAYNFDNCEIEKDSNIRSLLSKSGVEEYLKVEDLENINIDATTIQNCYDIINGEFFNLKENDGVMMLDSETIGKVKDLEGAIKEE